MILGPEVREIVTLAEWARLELPGRQLDGHDRVLVEALNALRRLRIDELASGLRIESRSWVGVVRFSGFDLRVVPKLAAENLGLVRLIDYASGLDSLKRYPSAPQLASQTDVPDLLDVLSLLLAEACEVLLRAGIHADYREEEAALPAVRGRILADRQVLRRFGRVDRVECRYDEHTTDIDENHVLAAALRTCATRVRDEGVGRRVRRMDAIFREICDPRFVDLTRLRADLTYNRLTEGYQEPHKLAWMILDAFGIGDVYQSGPSRCFAFLLDMNVLFEHFLRRWIAQLLAGGGLQLEPKGHEKSILWDVDGDRSYANVIPDLVVRTVATPRVRLVLDAKYKTYDESTVDLQDIYQSFLYAYGIRGASAGLPAACLAYPSSARGTAAARIEVRTANGRPGAELAILGVDIPAALAEARSGRSGPLGMAMLAQLHRGLRPSPSSARQPQ